MKKITLIIAFLIVLLLFGVWMHAATNEKRFTVEPKDAVTVVEVQKDMELVPFAVLL
jgi:hypothetical protein